MDRKEFLSQIGLSSALVFAGTCLGACSKGSTGTPSPAPPTSVDFSINLNDANYAALKTKGGYVVVNNIIVALSTSNTYLAVSSICPHQGVTVQFQAAQDQFFCNAHSSLFSSTGARISGPANSGLKQYNTSLSGTSLRIFS
jgi:cytochrome b6-f complex iron-sulfur subunit